MYTPPISLAQVSVNAYSTITNNQRCRPPPNMQTHCIGALIERVIVDFCTPVALDDSTCPLIRKRQRLRQRKRKRQRQHNDNDNDNDSENENDNNNTTTTTTTTTTTQRRPSISHALLRVRGGLLSGFTNTKESGVN
jgi:hypothetical protein